MPRTVKSNQLRIFAIDQATVSGWASNSPVGSGVADFGLKRGESPGMRFVRFEIWLERMIRKHRPQLVVYERQNHRGGAATEVASGLVALISKACAAHGINHTNCYATTLKKFATGKGNAKKPDMMAAYEIKWGKPPIDDNECDARWLLEWAKSEFIEK